MSDEAAAAPYSARVLDERVTVLANRVRRLQGAMVEMQRLAGRYDRGSDRPSGAFLEALRDFERDLAFVGTEHARLRSVLPVDRPPGAER